MSRARRFETVGAVLILGVLAGCGGPDRSGDDPWRWEAERGVTFGELRDECLDWQAQVVADHIASDLEGNTGHSFLFDSLSALAADLGASTGACRELVELWPAADGSDDGTFLWLDLLAATDSHPERDPDGLYALRRGGPPQVTAMAELLLFDATITMLIVERPTADSASRAVARSLLFTFDIDVGEATRLDDAMVLLALAEAMPEASRDLGSAPREMAGWAALAGLLRYLAGDLHRLSWCYDDTVFGPPLHALVALAVAIESDDGSLSRAAAYYDRNRIHYDQRCTIPPNPTSPN